MNSDELKIEKAVPSDAERWCQIRKECWLQIYPNAEHDITREDILLKDFDSPEKVQMWRDSFVVPVNNATYYTAKIGEEIVGICIAYGEQPVAEIGAIYVDLKYQHRGIGTKIMKHAMANFDPKKKVCLKVVTYNMLAIEFYKKLGFKITGLYDDPNGRLPNGKSLPEVEMVRE